MNLDSLFDAIAAAHRAIRPQAPVTPLEHSPALSALTGCEVYLKCEHLQRTGSFKFRGASNKLRLLDPAARRGGVIAASTGNHGQAVALAGRLLGVPVTVYAPASAAAVKLDAIRALGAELKLVDGDALAAELAAGEAARRAGLPFVSPYNDLDVVAGQGTVGMELAEQCPELDAVFVSVGGGGLISGIGTALRRLAPNAEMVGCWPEAAATMHASLQAGRIVEVDEGDTLSDGTAGGVEPGAVTFELCQALIRHCALLSEADIRAALRLLAQTERWMTEGAAGVALAGLLQLAPRYQGKKVAVVLCGRNIVLDKFLGAVAA
ncbi:threonine dehydratase [Chromobacterium alkanivorans]|uniref:threonine/serine dehydratase n=1 Tax=Chromobacterium alkanivorans TaxID=1071719 RepID=UPI002166EC28|nr:threonine/serine dehydratase [Chromobacterium alkanivorans]MCS3804588.1 threonine dehydratase [Chromobacterium alkanivorans]MCS3818927.1 threonine dehydratase [Chromobacterium alkanivorans]MCS3873215.1 threonine dehydratase [Chromobacterium alkanivorans]